MYTFGIRAWDLVIVRDEESSRVIRFHFPRMKLYQEVEDFLVVSGYGPTERWSLFVKEILVDKTNYTISTSEEGGRKALYITRY